MGNEIELARTVRMGVNTPAGPRSEKIHNGYSGWPALRGLGRYFELTVRCRGKADAVSGYFINITQIDAAARRRALPILESAAAGQADDAPMGGLLRRILTELQPELGDSVIETRLTLSPYLSYAIEKHDMNRLLIRQRYEFSAAHRLHVEGWPDDRNRAVFGKCNNPAGHGHNYEIEVVAWAPIDAQGQTLAIDPLDELVNRSVIEKLDHKHLNLDVPHFAKINPSVENIAGLIADWLAAALPTINLTLAEVSVWETPKTVCTVKRLEC